VLKDITRPSRPPGTPKLRGLYCFNADASRDKFRILSVSRSGITATIGARFGCLSFDEAAHASAAIAPWHSDDGWYDGNGQVLADVFGDGMGEYLLQECVGIVSFDAVLCRRCPKSILSGNWSERYAHPQVATVSLRGCESCHTAPEGPAVFGKSPVDHLPLLSPPPLHSSTVRAAQMPATNGHAPPPLYARCSQCIKDRHCNGCNAWWCESCYTLPESVPKDNDMEGPYRIVVSLVATVLRVVLWELLFHAPARVGALCIWQDPKFPCSTFPFKVSSWVSHPNRRYGMNFRPFSNGSSLVDWFPVFSVDMLFKSANERVLPRYCTLPVHDIEMCDIRSYTIIIVDADNYIMHLSFRHETLFTRD